MRSSLVFKSLCFCFFALLAKSVSAGSHWSPFLKNSGPTAGWPLVMVTADDAAVLQRCVDLAELQEFYPKNADGSYRRLVIMQHAVSFPETIAVSHNGQNLLFKAKGDAISGESYFYFHSFDVLDSTAKVEFTFYYDQNGTVPKMQVVTLQLQKSANGWNITNKKN